MASIDGTGEGQDRTEGMGKQPIHPGEVIRISSTELIELFKKKAKEILKGWGIDQDTATKFVEDKENANTVIYISTAHQQLVDQNRFNTRVEYTRDILGHLNNFSSELCGETVFDRVTGTIARMILGQLGIELRIVQERIRKNHTLGRLPLVGSSIDPISKEERSDLIDAEGARLLFKKSTNME